MSWPKMVSALYLALALAGCGTAHTPAASAETTVSPDSNHQQAARAQLRAVVRDQSFLDKLPESERRSTISEPLSGRMVILYLVDDRGAARGAQASDLVASGVTREALRAVVEWNLASLLPDPVTCSSHAVTEPTQRHYYETSRLLLDKQWADLARAGTVVVAAPSNDTLIVACNPTPEILQKLEVIVQNTYPQAARPVSPSLLTWSKDGWRALPAH